MKKKVILLVLICLILLISVFTCKFVSKSLNQIKETTKLDENPIYSEDYSDLYMTDLSEQIRPKKLLVLLFFYTGNSYYKDGVETEINKLWSDYIFGTGTIEEQTASINDYIKEISNGKFYYEPVFIGGNTTGVYNVMLDKTYSDAQFIHKEYPYFDFHYDLAHAMDNLIEQGLDINSFTAPGVNNDNYIDILENIWGKGQSYHNKEWYNTDTVLCIYPPVNLENVSFAPISSEYNNFTKMAHIKYDSSFGTIVHELLHTIGTVDVYNYGSFGGDIMSSLYAELNDYYNTMHVNPYYKILFGWEKATVLENSSRVVLYPATSNKYNPIIIKTRDKGQYFIIENRKPDSFDRGITIDASDGVNIWRIDKLGLEAIYDVSRKGIIAETLTYEGQSKKLNYYANYNNIKDVTEVFSGLKVDYIKKNEDGSIVVDIYHTK